MPETNCRDCTHAEVCAIWRLVCEEDNSLGILLSGMCNKFER